MIHQVAKEVWKYEAPFPLSFVGRYFFEPRWLKKLASLRVMTLSPSSAESLRDYGLRDLVVVLPGSDDVEVRGGTKDPIPTICFLGRLVKSKRPVDAVKAFSRVRDAFPEARMWMMGDGAMRKSLARMNQPGLELLGHVPNEVRTDRVSRSHVLVTTTVREGWGLNVSEAAALGTPTIGYDSAGLRDSIPMSGGHLVSQDSDALGDALVAFFEGKLRLAPRIATQPWSGVARQIEGELQSALSRSRG
jgi:glycosyltransferase involved in cell wall biosynthesis